MANAFSHYENIRSHIVSDGETTTIVTSGVGFNDVNFQMQLNETPRSIVDGLMAFARVSDYHGELLVQKKRMRILGRHLSAKSVAKLGNDDCLRVLGIPRIDLTLVAWRVQHHDEPKWSKLNVLDWNLPYEIIVVGVYPQKCKIDE